MIKRALFGTLSTTVLAISPALFAQSNYEQRIHEIYKQSYSQEVSDELWSQYTQGLSTRTYTVSEGDTLWDLSVIFFGDGQYWSKIWSYNQSLTNPHLIRVGKEIAFFSGSISTPPGVSIDGDKTPLTIGGATFQEVPGSSETSLNSSTDSVQQARLYPGAPSIPPPRDQIAPAPENLPSTFRDFDGFSTAEYNFQGISMDIRPPVQVNPLYVAQQFLYEKEVKNYPKLGWVLESENGNSQLGLHDQIYIESEQALQIGETVTVMSYDHRFDRNGVYGSVIRYSAQVRIIEKLPDNVFLGEIFYSLSGVRKGSWITRENIPTFGDDLTGRPSRFVTTVIGGGLDNASRIYGEGDVIYLDGGSSMGLRAGDVLGIYKNRLARNEESEVPFSPMPIGHAKVFRVEERLATAFIVDSSEEIVTGDKTGSSGQQVVEPQAQLGGVQSDSMTLVR